MKADAGNISVDRFVALLSLAHRVHRPPGGILSAKFEFVEGLAEILDAEFGACALVRPGTPEPQIVALASAVRSRSSSDALHDVAGVDLIRWVTDSNRKLPAHAIASHVTLPGGKLFAGVALSRPESLKPFKPSDHTLLHLFHEAMNWMYDVDRPLASPSAEKLTEREKQTLQYLLAGIREVDIPPQMRLTRDTVHHYVKKVFAQFGVSSRAQLIAEWQRDVGR